MILPKGCVLQNYMLSVLSSLADCLFLIDRAEVHFFYPFKSSEGKTAHVKRREQRRPGLQSLSCLLINKASWINTNTTSTSSVRISHVKPCASPTGTHNWESLYLHQRFTDGKLQLLFLPPWRLFHQNKSSVYYFYWYPPFHKFPLEKYCHNENYQWLAFLKK